MSINKRGQVDLRELPSWKYMGWGILNGLFLSISLKFGMDISETGIFSQILNAFKPLLESVHQSTSWITLIVIFFGIIGIISTVVEVIAIYNKGWIPRVIALCGFISILLIVLNFLTSLAVIILIIGAGLVAFFPDE